MNDKENTKYCMRYCREEEKEITKAKHKSLLTEKEETV